MADKDQLIQQLSEKYKVPPAKIERAVESQFKFVSRKMRDPEFPSIRLPFFGVFKANPKRLKHLDEKRRKAIEHRKKQSKKES